MSQRLTQRYGFHLSMDITMYYYILTCISIVQAETMLRLSSGANIPFIGLGTHGLDKEDLDNILTNALEIGYRYIDTAFIYQNEETIGKTLKKWFEKGGNRSQIFITSKLPYFANHAFEVEKYLKMSLDRLLLDYVDMYLIHAPFGVTHKNNSYDFAKNENGSLILDQDIDHIKIWKEMEKQVKAGRVKSIGLSNFNETQILNILAEAEIKPSNLQIEVHLYHQQKPLIDFCRKHNIVVTGYAPLGSPHARQAFHPNVTETELPNPFKLPILNEIARKHKKTNAQILLRYAVQKRIVVIPSSKAIDHLKTNFEIFDFELTEEEMNQLNKLDKGYKGKIFDYKFLKGIENHSQYPFTSSQ